MVSFSICKQAVCSHELPLGVGHGSNHPYYQLFTHMSVSDKGVMKSAQARKVTEQQKWEEDYSLPH